MKRFKNILVAVDTRLTTHPLIDGAAEIAQSNGATLKLIDVLPDFSWIAHQLTDELGHLRDLLRQEKAEKLESLAAPLRESGIEVATKVIAGKSSVEIIREVLRDEHDLVMAVAKGQNSKTPGFFGQTARRLLRQCPCALWLVPEGAKPKPKHVAGCVDISSDDPVDAELNDKVYELAISISEQYDCNYSILHSWFLDDEVLLSHRLTQKQINEYAEKQLQHRKKLMEKFLGQHDASMGNAHFVRGKTAKTIPAFLKDKNVDLVVMGTVARSGILGAYIGNTAEATLDHVKCSVLAVKPYRFKSSIRVEKS